MVAASPVDPLSDIPKSLPGIFSIERYPVANASKVLIHVRQIHESSIASVLRWRQDNASPEAIACHHSIREGMSALLSVYPCDALYLEGLHQSDVQIRREGVALFRDLIDGETSIRSNLMSRSATERRLLVRGLSEGKKTPVSLDEFQSLVQKTESRLDEQSISHSTAIQLAARFNLSIESPNSSQVEAFLEKLSKPIDELDALNAEVASIDARARAMVLKYSGQSSVSTGVLEQINSFTASMEKAAQKKAQLSAEIEHLLKSQQNSVYELRDEALVSLVAQRPPKVAGVERVLALWGAAHDLRPVVVAHNAAHRDNTIALVVITPNPVRELEQEHPLR